MYRLFGWTLSSGVLTEALTQFPNSRETPIIGAIASITQGILTYQNSPMPCDKSLRKMTCAIGAIINTTSHSARIVKGPSTRLSEMIVRIALFALARFGSLMGSALLCILARKHWKNSPSFEPSHWLHIEQGITAAVALYFARSRVEKIAYAVQIAGALLSLVPSRKDQADLPKTI